MNLRIFGFQRRVWWPKWTPASRSSRMLTAIWFLPWLGCDAPTGTGGTGRRGRHRHLPRIAGSGTKSAGIVAGCSRFGVRAPIHDGAVSMRESSALEELSAEIQATAWELALAVVDEGLLDDQVPSLQRL